jgi:hypothetical protein
MYNTLSTKRLRVLLALFAIIGLSGNGARAQDKEPEREKPDTLIKGDIDHGFVFSFDDKLSSIDGDFANFTGIHVGWLIDHRFLIGLAGYGTTDAPRGVGMGYGGVVVAYFFDPNKMFNYSVRGLIGGGGADNNGYHHHRGHDDFIDGFLVAEPEVRGTLNVLGPFRLGFGVGYRFVGGAGSGHGLSGPTFNISFKFGKF